jgi:hypothetical protein
MPTGTTSPTDRSQRRVPWIRGASFGPRTPQGTAGPRARGSQRHSRRASPTGHTERRILRSTTPTAGTSQVTADARVPRAAAGTGVSGAAAPGAPNPPSHSRRARPASPSKHDGLRSHRTPVAGEVAEPGAAWVGTLTRGAYSRSAPRRVPRATAASGELPDPRRPTSHSAPRSGRKECSGFIHF